MSDSLGKQLLKAAWIAPMERAVIPDGAVVFDHRIIAVGDARAMVVAHPDAWRTDLGDVCLMPGLINAHTHLELSTMTPGERPTGLAPWLKRVVDEMRSDEESTESRVRRGVEEGVRQCLKFGVTTVGDITSECALTRRVLNDTPLRGVSYGEVRAMGQRRELLEERLRAASDTIGSDEGLRVGISPHAPYSIEREGYERCLQMAVAGGMPLATHLAETRDEAAFLSDHDGPLRDLWDRIGGWDEQVTRFDGGPIRYAQSMGLLSHPTLLAHVNYVDDDELDLLAKGKASVVYCPRTHAYFQHEPHRFREMLARGVNVALGTDSLASAPDLSMVGELQTLHALHGDLSSQALWEMATFRAAKAMGQEGHLGSITPGKHADFAAFAIRGSDPLTEVIESAPLPIGVWIGGKRVAT